MKVIYDGSPDSRAFKDLFSTMIPSMLDNDPDLIYLDADLMSCIGVAKYAKNHPDRCINCGIAEANMAGIAAGLSAAGFNPICHSFGTFTSRRCFDQVFLSGAYAKNPMTLIGTDPGVCAAMNGGTHMPFEDVALYRAIPGATVIDVADAAQLENVFPKLVQREGVKYLRVNRKANTLMYEAGSDFEIGKGVLLREGKDITLISAGYTLGCTMKAAEQLAEKGVSATVIDMFTIKPLDEELVVKYAEKTGAVVTDKAVNPPNIMGATKRVTEIMLREYSQNTQMKCMAVRFGNVLGSNGSVIPLMIRQIKHGGPVTVTHRNIVRFFMTIPEAAQLVLQTMTFDNTGDIFVFDMGEPVKIYDVAVKLIEMFKLEPEKDIKIKIIGLRPGEKLYEELVMAEEDAELLETSNSKIMQIEQWLNIDGVNEQIDRMIDFARAGEYEAVKILMELVPSLAEAKKKTK